MTFALPLQALAPEQQTGSMNKDFSVFDSKLKWVDDSGKDFLMDSLKGKPLVLSFFYASCAKICPLTVGKIKQIKKDNKEKKIEANYVLITIDPDEDTVKELHNYRESMGLVGKNIYLLRAKLKQTEGFAKTLGFEFGKDQSHVIHKFKIFKLSAVGKLEDTIVWENKDETDD